MDEDLYAALGVPRDADADTIKRAWRDLARRLHPDRNPGDAAAAAAFTRASAAWTVLSDPDRKLVYDHLGAGMLRAGSVADLAAGIRESLAAKKPRKAPDVPPQREADWRARERAARASGPPPMARDPRPKARTFATDIRVALALTLREAARGGRRVVRVEEDGPCADCEGTGQRATGRFCPSCGGSGHRVASREVEVDVPVSVASGQLLRVPGAGREGSDGRRGAVIVAVSVAPDPVFHRIGTVLRVDVPLVAGARTVEAPTLEGTVTVDVPPKAKAGTLIRVPGRGMPGAGGRPPGDLVVRLT